jgi:hypothetical protein
VGSRAGHDEAEVPHPADQPGQRLERQLEALLVHEPSDEEDQPLVAVGEVRAKRVEVVDRHELGRVDPVGDHGDAGLVEAVDVRHVAAHVVRTGDDPVRAARHPALHLVDVGLRMLVHPALVPAVLGGVDGRDPGAAVALG